MRRALASFCRESPNSTVESRFSAFFAARFACSLMCGVTHISDDSRKDWIVRRCHSLDRERGGRPVAGNARLAELSPQSVWTCELPDLSVRRAASEPCSVRPAQRTTVCGVCSRRPCQRGAPRCRQRACLAGPAGASRAALRPGVEARTGERSEAQEELSRGAGGGAADQLCGCRADAAGRAPGAAAGGDFEVP